jgi:hypothetical protein
LAAQCRVSFARASGRCKRRIPVAVVLTNLIGWSRKMHPVRKESRVPQFLAGIDNCNIVAIDTPTKYGTGDYLYSVGASDASSLIRALGSTGLTMW